MECIAWIYLPTPPGSPLLQALSSSCALPEVRGAVTFSGVFDLRPLVTTYVNEPLKLTE